MTTDTRLPPPKEDAPLNYPLARGIETTVYTYLKKTDKPLMNDTSKPVTGFTTRLYHDCGGEWEFAGQTEYTDGKTWYRSKCSGCGAYGKRDQVYPINKVL